MKTQNSLNHDAAIQTFRETFQTRDWAWVENPTALEHYFMILYLLDKYGLRLVPDQLADTVLHAHLQRPTFAEDMQALFGQMLVHEAGATETDATLTHRLVELEFGSGFAWQADKCNILLAA